MHRSRQFGWIKTSVLFCTPGSNVLARPGYVSAINTPAVQKYNPESLNVNITQFR